VLGLLAGQSAGALDYALAFEELRALTETLEGRVAERTADLTHANRALRTISDCNQELIRAESERELLNRLCRSIVTNGGYRMAWVGYAEQDEARTVRPDLYTHLSPASVTPAKAGVQMGPGAGCPPPTPLRFGGHGSRA
jgi:hypothetical protein